jgi:hypothetical protein
MQIQEWRSTWLKNKLLSSDEQEKNQQYSLA